LWWFSDPATNKSQLGLNNYWAPFGQPPDSRPRGWLQ
jgi:hypothetical protein